MKMIVLTTSDNKQKFWVNPEEIVAMYRHHGNSNDWTMIHYRCISSTSCWNVVETPEQIAALAKIRVIEK